MSFCLLCLFVTLIGEVSGSSAEHAEVVVEVPFLLISGELAILSQLGSEVRPCGTGHRFVGQLGGAVEFKSLVQSGFFAFFGRKPDWTALGSLGMVPGSLKDWSKVVATGFSKNRSKTGQNC